MSAHLSVLLCTLPPTNPHLYTISVIPWGFVSRSAGFRLVSTLDHASEGATPESVPGLLLLGQSESPNGEGVVRELLVVQCPPSLVTEWSMELGLLPDPRPAMEVLPGKKPISVCILLLAV